jgi:hypothetical protein
MGWWESVLNALCKNRWITPNKSSAQVGEFLFSLLPMYWDRTRIRESNSNWVRLFLSRAGRSGCLVGSGPVSPVFRFKSKSRIAEVRARESSSSKYTYYWSPLVLTSPSPCLAKVAFSELPTAMKYFSSVCLFVRLSFLLLQLVR